MSKYPQSCYIVGEFLGVYPIKEVKPDFHTQDFGIDTKEDFGNVKVFQATKTALTDFISELSKFKKGDLVKVNSMCGRTKRRKGSGLRMFLRGKSRHSWSRIPAVLPRQCGCSQPQRFVGVGRR